MLTRDQYWNATSDFTVWCLRGVGQVMLQDNAITGLVFLIGIFISDWVSGLYAILGTAVATASAWLFGAPSDKVRHGLAGFNGTLTGIGLAFSLEHDALLFVYVIVASVFVTIVTAAIKDIFGAKGYPLTGPFVLTTWIFVSPLLSYERLHGAAALGAQHALSGAVPTFTQLSITDLGAGFLNGVAQVMLQQNALTGAIFLVAIAINSRLSCAVAALGSLIGLGVALLLGAAPIAISEGLFGFNGVLTAIAIGGVFFPMRALTAVLAVLAVCVSTILYGSFSSAFALLQVPVLTAPFVLTTWLFLLAKGTLSELREESSIPR
ncbi:MAG TPA: urea transporter [Xanthobacteraceae bacterium]|nr:urea transporter [Xanthobacteraceae bacterium]